MSISDDDIAHFQALYKTRFGTEISKEDAYQKGVRLVRLMQIILKSKSKNKKNYDQPSNKKI